MLSFTTRVVNGATEIVESDGTWRFADRLEVEMMERIAVLEAALREAVEAFDVIAIEPVDPSDGQNHARNDRLIAKRASFKAHAALSI